MRFKRSLPEDDMRVELTSMTDIIFLLLIFFMISTTFEPGSRHLDMQLPEAKAGEAAQDSRRYVIELGLPNTLHVDGQAMSLQELSQRLSQESNPAAPRSVTIRADKRLPYGEVITVLDVVQQAHIRDIAVAVQ
jgi:biopolymer transport protein ExbD